MDDFLAENRRRWNQLVQAGVSFGRPILNLTPGSARAFLDPYGMLGSVEGMDVLCLASGGGQQTAAFAVLGAHVTVLDLSDEMLARDQQAARHYGVTIRLEQGDMRDLSRFSDECFDLVYQMYSINFVPDPRPVFDEVSRVLRPGGRYFLQFSNPFTISLDENSWDGSGYRLTSPYINGSLNQNLAWDVTDENGVARQMEGPREWQHALSTMLNGLIKRGFIMHGLWEEMSPDPQATPGSWDHFLSYSIPWFSAWFIKG